ncbi:hypothetical protein L2E82_35671 [Cichorium intybus]|uniref:Uncharacterized protein n=1 Tax=Cichorium intybus TaxID=13427 RepID=A0ACB9BPS7_CICIN|nr:hypothetical protein L2E82_35671 [Cichorium intybus]
MTGGGEAAGTSTGEKSVMDITSPYFLTAADHPGQNFVGENLLHDGNYSDWQNEMTNALFAKNKIGFVDGSIPMPKEGSGDLMNWKRCNAMVRGWLVSAMEKEIKSSVKYAITARDIWLDLQERFGKENAPRAYELRRIVTTIRQEDMSVSAYYTKLRGVWDEIHSINPIPTCSCQGCKCEISKEFAKMREKERLYDFLMGLNEEYGAVKTQILSTSPLPSLGIAYHLVSQDEKQRQIGTVRNSGNNVAAFQTSGRFSPKSSGKTSSQTTNKKKNEVCTHCQKTGHTIEGCFELIGYPEWWIPRTNKTQNNKSKTTPRAAATVSDDVHIPNITKDEYDKLMKMLRASQPGENTKKSNPTANMTGKTTNPNDSWVIDSGASDHITYREDWLKDPTNNVDFTSVTIPNGKAVAVKKVGNIGLSEGINLKDVLSVPEFKCNLLSVSKIARDLQCFLTFYLEKCFIQDLPSRNLIGTGKERNGLYYLEPFNRKKMAMVVWSKNEIWHKRLGHASEGVLKKIQKLGNIGSSSEFCDSCIRAKQSRLPFPISFAKTASSFDLIHVDIWGRYKHASLDGAYYFLSIVDDYSRGVWVYLMKTKSEASHYLMFFYNMIETQFGKRVKRIRTDNGSEFRSRHMLDFYATHGILLETSCPYTPQQNGVVERKHRHLLEMARALRFQASLPIEFWGECVLTAAYVINKLPTPVLENKTPHEILLGKEPTYDHFRVFGCLAYAHDTLGKQDKFRERGRACVFLGYPMGQKGYKLYDVKNQKTYITRNVTFVGNIFPFGEDYERHKDIDAETFVDSINGAGKFVDNYAPPVQEKESQTESDVHLNQNTRSESVETFENNTTNSTAPPVSSEPSVQEQTETTRQSTRIRTKPKRLDEFSKSHRAFLTAITANKEPKNFSQAVKDPEWREAMKREIQALEENGTWTLTHLPAGKKAIDSKWVYKVKYKPNGQIERYKARLVAKGYTQVEGIDFHETFAPVAKLVTVRCALAVAAKKQWEVHQLDVNNAFLHGDLDEDVYMKVPQGFLNVEENRVCKLHKSIYGLKQASRNWYQKFTKALISDNFRQSKADHSMFVYKTEKIHIIALIYVDDILLMGNDIQKIEEVKTNLQNKFSIKNMGPLKYFLGIEVARSPKGFVISQRKYTLDILKDCHAHDCRPSTFPMEQNLRLEKEDASPEVDESKYRRLVGRLLYLTVTRPDITFSVNQLSQFINKPRQSHMDAALRVLRYLKATPGQGLFLPAEGNLILEAYCDASWLSCHSTRRSCTGYFISIGGSPVSWRTQKQSVVARSSAEAEYRSMASTICEVLWLRWLLCDLDAVQEDATALMCDNEAARHIAVNPVYHERTKHVEMDCYFVRERVASGEIKTVAIKSEEQPADIFTKALGANQFQYLRGKLGVRDLHSPT